MSPHQSFKLFVVMTQLTIVLGAFSIATPANAAPLPPTVIAQAQAPITVEAGDYVLLGLNVIMPPGDYVGQHTHSGPDLITAFEGEVINHKGGKDQTIKTGENWLDLPGEMHAVTNAGNITARLWASALLPKGDTSLTGSIQIPLTIEAGEYSLIGQVLDFAPGSGVAEHSRGGNAVFYVLNGEITLMENGASKQVKAFQSWTEVPGAAYAVANASGNTARVAMSMLLPKGEEEITFVSTPTPPPAQDVPTVGSSNQPATQTKLNSNTQILPVLIGVGVVLILLAVGFYLRRRSR